MVSLNRKVVRPKGGKREDLGGLFLRSAMEANTARVLEALRQRAAILAWWYEPHVFTFAFGRYTRGPWAYTPDFLVQWNPLALASRNWAEAIPGKRPAHEMPLPVGGDQLGAITVATKVFLKTTHNDPSNRIWGEYFEVKGREMPSDRSKAKRMKKHFPDVQVTQIGRAEYKAMEQFWMRMIPTWEGGRRCRR